MSQDIVSDALNQIKNASKVNKKSILLKRYSKFLIEVLKIMKQNSYIKNYKLNEKERTLEITLDEINECRAIKPRFDVSKDEIEKYLKRYLPARDYGLVLISTNQGLLTHKEAMEKNIGGSLIAYFY